MLVNCQKTYEVLDTLGYRKSPDIDGPTVEYLAGKALIIIKTPEEYADKKQKSERFEELKKQVVAQKTAMLMAVAKLEGHMKEEPHGFFISQKKREYESILRALERNLREEQSKIELATEEFARVNAHHDEIYGCVQTPHGYLKTTVLGRQRRNELRARLYRLADQEFEALENEVAETSKSLDKRIARWETLYDIATRQKKHLVGEELREAMAILSGREQYAEKNLERFAAMQKEFETRGHYKENGGIGYITYALMALQEASPAETVTVINMIIRKSLHSLPPCPETTDLVALIYRTEPTGQQLARFDELFSQISRIEDDYSRGTVAAILAETEEDSVKKFNTIHKGLCDLTSVSEGHHEIISAAAHLAKHPGDEKLKRWITFYRDLKEHDMMKYGMYNIITELTLKPGSIDEIIQIFDLTVNKTEQNRAYLLSGEKFSLAAHFVANGLQCAKLPLPVNS